MLSALFFVAFLALPSLAAVNPTSPDSTTVVRVGSDLTALWDVDTTGTWKNLEIQLMTGGNLQMVELAVIGKDIDGTTSTSYSIPCPDVSPYSQIYFLQFTPGGDVTQALWSTRFTIAGADGSTTEPTNMTNWNGADVKWGTGTLLGNVDVSAPSNPSDSSVPSISAIPSGSSSASGLNAIASPSRSSTGFSGAEAGASVSASGSASVQTSGAASKNMAVGGGAVMLALAGWLL